MSERHAGSGNGIPGLGRSPGLLSGLFSSKSSSRQRTELIIFIRPQIIRNGVDARRIAEELRGKMRNLFGPALPPPLPPPPPVEKYSGAERRKVVATATDRK